MALLRLDRIISNSGAASRREAAELIRSGRVTVDGVPARSGADKYDPEQVSVCVDGAVISYSEKTYIMMNKPAGYLSATEDARDRTVIDLLDDRSKRLRLFAAGRLDKDSEGLLILTNDGDFAHRIISPKKKVMKTYFVETQGRLTEDDTEAFARGITLESGEEFLPGRLEIISSGETSTALVSIGEGKYHQVKRMLVSRGKPVLYLKRVKIGGLDLDGSLKKGEYRELTAEERRSIFE